MLQGFADSTEFANNTSTLLDVATDRDADGLPESFENQVANAFTPFYYVSGNERLGTGFATFGNFTPQINAIQQVFSPYQQPPSPISHFRVQPLRFATDQFGVQYGLLRIDYFTLWNRDDGPTNECTRSATITFGLAGYSAARTIDALLSHPLDNERSAVLVAAPTTSFNTYNLDPNAYSAYRYYTAAHEGVRFSDRSRYTDPEQPIPAGLHVNLGLSRSKHATYTFNPDSYPIVNPGLMAATYVAINADYAFFGNYRRYLALLFIADVTSFGCFIEDFDN